MNDLPSRPGARILRHDQADRWIDGYAFLQGAREEAGRIRDEVQQVAERARAEGFARGREEGAAEAARLLARTGAEVEAYLAGLEGALADLALDIARRVLGELDAGERLAACTRQALTAFRDDQRLTLQVAAGELEAARTHLDELGARLALEACDDLEPGQARLSSPAATVELGLDTQLRALREALRPSVAQDRP